MNRPSTGIRDWWDETAEIAERAKGKAEERAGLQDRVITLPQEARPRAEYECRCGAIERQDCYCWDRRPSPARTAGLLAILASLGGFWFWVFRLIFGGG